MQETSSMSRAPIIDKAAQYEHLTADVADYHPA